MIRAGMRCFLMDLIFMCNALTMASLCRFPSKTLFLPQMLLNITQVHTQGAYRYLNFPYQEGQGSNQEQECHPKYPHRSEGQLHINQKHGEHAKQEAADAKDLHIAGEVEPQAEVLNLGNELGIGMLKVLAVQLAYHCGISQKAVGIGQHDQRDGRKQKGGCGEGEFGHGVSSLS